MKYQKFPIPKVTRLSESPLLCSVSHSKIGTNLNGPSVIKVPDWIPAALGTYYLYFAHHTGTFVRLAYADHLEGPWTVSDKEVLHLNDTGFSHVPVALSDELNSRGMLLAPHIASPDVHVDDAQKKITMLFHGLHRNGQQATRIADSNDGISFVEASGDVAPPYLRACRFGSGFLGISWGGEVFTSPKLGGPYLKGPALFERPNGPDLIPRHPMLVSDGKFVHVFYSLIGDCPERIWHLPSYPGDGWNNWRLGLPSIVLAPRLTWEGVDLPCKQSNVGPAWGLEHGLRDPCVFCDYLFYVGGGESGIGVSRIEWNSAV